MRRDMPMKERIDRVGELLAKAVYLCVKKKQKEEAEKKMVKNEDKETCAHQLKNYDII